ncbi:MAG TPA: O-linked N-acetylglucosamine transferase, SPINDLY family protein [Chroococcidiopsis sp.]
MTSPTASSVSSSPLSSLEQQAERLVAQQEYGQAAAIYQQLLEADPDVQRYCWLLGLMYVLQGEDAEAQFVWAIALSDGEPEQVAAGLAELRQVLAEAADRFVAAEQYELAWQIRQCGREVDPADLDNLLGLLDLSVPLGRVDDTALADLQALLTDEKLTDEELTDEDGVLVDGDRLWATLQTLLTTIPLHPALPALIEAGLVWATDRQAWANSLFVAANTIVRLQGNTRLGIIYANLCLQADPDHLEALSRLSCYYQDEQRYEEGIATARRYLERCQTLVQRVIGNAVLLRGLMSTGGRWDEANVALQAQSALLEDLFAEFEQEPSCFLDASVLCTSMFFYPYLTDAPAETRSLQNRMAQTYQISLRALMERSDAGYQPYPDTPLVRTSPRSKLRIGYISKFMRMHSVGWLSRWLFEYYDRDRFEVYAYFNQQSQVDAFSKMWFADKATAACCFEGDVLGIAKAIRDDEIDILVDLDSITSDYTCGVMALKPAPVQVTWLGLDASGLPAIDYFLVDNYVVPPDADRYYAERLWRLPQTYIAVDGFEVSTPTLRREQLGIPADAVIYLSAQFAYKRHPDTVRRQINIVRQVPNSYFLLKGAGDEQAIQALFYQIADEEGVDRDRLRFLPREATEFAHRANLAIADVVLDTYPYNGATTTLETLWMGIPIVTQVGRQFASRNSYGMMLNAGITEGIAHSPEEYIEWGVRLGSDPLLRQQVSWKLRQGRQTAPLWNAKQFTRQVEAAYEGMWQRYLDEGPS